MKYPMGHWGAQLGPFIKTKLHKLGQQIFGERVNREITNFHLLHWRATKVVKVVVCARSPILLSMPQILLGFQLSYQPFFSWT